MKIWILPIAFLGAVAVSGCERTVVTPPSNTAVVPVPSTTTVVPVPGPAGAPGPQGTSGTPGAPGKSGDTIVVVPPSSPSKY